TSAQHGNLLGADEIQSGAGRTGTMWAVEQWGVKPDILLTAKGIASGMTLAALVARADLLEAWGPGAHGSTYGGNPVACAAALATIDLLQGGLVENARTHGEQAQVGLAGARGPDPGPAPRGRGAGPDDRHRVRHRRACRGGAVGRVPARAARPRMRQVVGPDVAGADRLGGRDGNRAPDLRRGGRRRGRRGRRPTGPPRRRGSP